MYDVKGSFFVRMLGVVIEGRLRADENLSQEASRRVH